MILQTRVAPPNSLLLVMDQTVGKVPDSMNHGLVAATASCVAVGTLSEADGETLILLSDELPSQLQTQLLVFDGVLATPSKKISVCSVVDDSLLVLDVPESSTRVRIWANHAVEPDEIIVVVGDVAA